ncbi:MAG: methyltransferase domain-containing protein, partial [Candidatus Binatia bacterium]
GAGTWQIEIADVEQGLPYGGETFDIVIAEQILEHLRNPAFALSEMLRVARKDALIVIGVPIMPRCGVYLRKLFKNPDSEHVQSFTLKNLKSLLFSGGSLVELSTRGFRVISGGPLRWLENYEWWYRLNAKMGEIFPGLCIEVQIAAKKI